MPGPGLAWAVPAAKIVRRGLARRIQSLEEELETLDAIIGLLVSERPRPTWPRHGLDQPRALVLTTKNPAPVRGRAPGVMGRARARGRVRL